MASLPHSTARRWSVATSANQHLTFNADQAYIDPGTGALVLRLNSGDVVTVFSRGAWMQVSPR